MTIKLIFQLIIIAAMACCVAFIIAITIHSVQDMFDSVSANMSRVSIPMP